MELGSGAIRAVFMCNMLVAIAFSPFFFFANEPLGWQDIHYPLLVSFIFFVATIMVVSAIRLGGVTIQSPLMGVKIIFVAFLSVFLHAGAVQPSWWLGASLSAIAIFLLGFSGLQQGRHVIAGALLALSAAASYGLADVLVQKWASAWHYGPLNFMAVTMLGVAVLSIGLIPLFRWRLRDTPKPAWRWLLVGSSLMALQELCFTVPIGLVGKATVVNILYSSRGIWSIVLVWAVGHWFSSQEQHVGVRTMLQRLGGALMLFSAIVIVLLD
ncbi:MAG TPA: hypothetical protein DIU37_05410 [Opitutae bacterium]|nr:hypothetical protein [Opitutae bacterium]